MRRAAGILAIIALAVAGCRTGQPYPALEGPRYAGGIVQPGTGRSDSDLRIVTFNIEFALQVDSAIALLIADTILRRADVVLLQEMDAPATEQVAAALGMTWVYYPSLLKYKYQRDVGNAVLSRWPIIADAKLILPHTSAFVGTRRTATAATIQVGAVPVRVYSAHLGTVFNVNPQQRANQLRAILQDAEGYERVILGGDMNDAEVGRAATAKGYAWPTEKGPRTAKVGRLDHIFLKGFTKAQSTGTVLDVRGSSDHRPVWTTARLGR